MRDVTGKYTWWNKSDTEDLIKCPDGVYRPRSVVEKKLPLWYNRTGKPIDNSKNQIGRLLDKEI
jgi:hypothetical protein